MADEPTGDGAEALAEVERRFLDEHVADRDGHVWRIVRDGGMATRAHYAGVVSIGINRLATDHGPILTLREWVEDARRDAAREALADLAASFTNMHQSGAYRGCGLPFAAEVARKRAAALRDAGGRHGGEGAA